MIIRIINKIILLLRLAWRNLWRNRKRSWITISSVIFAVLLAISIQSIEYGSHEKMIENIVHYSTGYIQIQDTLYYDEMSIDNALIFTEETGYELKKQFPEIDYFIPRIEGFSLITAEVQSRIAFVKGVDFEKEDRIGNISERLEKGHFPERDEFKAVIGKGLARLLDISIGDTIYLIGQGYFGMTAAGKFPVGGIIRHPVPELNNQLIYLPLKAAQWYFAADDMLTSLLVQPKNIRHHERLTKELNKYIDQYGLIAYTWEELQPELLQIIEFDKMGNIIILLILYIVIGFGVFGTILTMTLEREKEFGTLLSLGMHRRELALMSFMETIFISFTGVVIGALVTIPFVFYFHKNPIPMGGKFDELWADYGLEPELPFSIDPYIFYEQAIIVFVISCIICMYPIFRIFSLKILEATRK